MMSSDDKRQISFYIEGVLIDWLAVRPTIMMISSQLLFVTQKQEEGATKKRQQVVVTVKRPSPWITRRIWPVAFKITSSIWR
jgi:hypothetical protein